jgi:hypothetical protein
LYKFESFESIFTYFSFFVSFRIYFNCFCTSLKVLATQWLNSCDFYRDKMEAMVYNAWDHKSVGSINYIRKYLLLHKCSGERCTRYVQVGEQQICVCAHSINYCRRATSWWKLPIVLLSIHTIWSDTPVCGL